MFNRRILTYISSMRSLYTLWLNTKIRRKMSLFIIFQLIVIVTAAVINGYLQRYAVYGMGDVLSDITCCENVEKALDAEESALRAYMIDPTADARTKLDEAVSASEAALANLPYDYVHTGAERYGRTWNLRNAYSNYAREREEMTGINLESEGAIARLYAVYDDIYYLQSYVKRITQLTVEAGAIDYDARIPVLRSIPGFMAMIFLVLLIISLLIYRAVSGSLVTPLQKLSAASRRIAEGDFGGEDVTVENRDEVGELVHAFNAMKHSIDDSIRVLRQNQELEDQVHRDEIERMELEKQLEQARLDLLQSQINPHFLFNTLNSIAGMADYEEAEVSRQMTLSLSNIFRYNLHTTDQFVSLEQELSVARDYLYLQKMRFGDRLQYDVDTDGVETSRVSLPVFLLQPLVENAVVHGIGKKVEGGRVTVTVRTASIPSNVTGDAYEPAVRIEIRDTGVGIPQEQLTAMTRALEESLGGSMQESAVGIGVGNVYRRLHGIYPNASMTIRSREGLETIVTIVLPTSER